MGRILEAPTRSLSQFECALHRHDAKEPIDCSDRSPWIGAVAPKELGTPACTEQGRNPRLQLRFAVRRESAMVVANADDPQSLVEVVQRMTGQCRAAAASVETLVQENKTQRTKFERLQHEHEDLRNKHEELHRHLDTCVEAVAKLEAERDALLQKCEAGASALADLRERHEALAQARELARGQMEAALRQLGA